MRCRSGMRIVPRSGLLVEVHSSQVLNLTATYTIFETVEGLRRLIRQTQDAAAKPDALTTLGDSKEPGSSARSLAGVLQRVQNSTGLSLECWIAPLSQPSREGIMSSRAIMPNVCMQAASAERQQHAIRSFSWSFLGSWESKMVRNFYNEWHVNMTDSILATGLERTSVETGSAISLPGAATEASAVSPGSGGDMRHFFEDGGSSAAILTSSASMATLQLAAAKRQVHQPISSLSKGMTHAFRRLPHQNTSTACYI